MGYRGNSANFSRDSAFALDFMNTHFPLCNRHAIVTGGSVFRTGYTRWRRQDSCSLTVTLHYTVQLFCRGRWLTYDDKCRSVTATLAWLREWLRNAARSSDHHTLQSIVLLVGCLRIQLTLRFWYWGASVPSLKSANVQLLTERFSRYFRICPVDTFLMSRRLLSS